LGRCDLNKAKEEKKKEKINHMKKVKKLYNAGA